MSLSNRILLCASCAIALVCLLPACARQSHPQAAGRGGTSVRGEEGLASWYGNRFRGRRTASGARFNPKAMTAAHRTLPFGTRVRVVNVHNERAVEVTITDRGPFIRKRIIDLSRAAARELGMLGSGVARVRLERLPPPSEVTDDRPVLQ